MKTDNLLTTHLAMVKRYIQEGKPIQSYYDLKIFEDTYDVPAGLRLTSTAEV